MRFFCTLILYCLLLYQPNLDAVKLAVIDISDKKISYQDAIQLLGKIQQNICCLERSCLDPIKKATLIVDQLKKLHKVICQRKIPVVKKSDNKKENYLCMKTRLKRMRSELCELFLSYQMHYWGAIESIANIVNCSEAMKKSDIHVYDLLDYCSSQKQKQLQKAVDNYFKAFYNAFGFENFKKLSVSSWFGKLRKDIKKLTHNRYKL